MGLAIVKELAELMGGTVDARSRLGVGSMFGFEVPLAVNVPQPGAVIRYPRVVVSGTLSPGQERLLAQLALYRKPDPALPPVTIASDEWEQPLKSRWLFERLTGERARPDRPAFDKRAEARTFAGVRVLLVEDNIVNQRVGARLIERLGCRVDVAANGAEAIELVRQLPYDMVFMDCQMPEMDGFEATRRVRQMPGPAAAVPIIALTASASENDRKACLARGMDGYLSKPASFASLTEMVNQWVNRPSSQAPAPAYAETSVEEP